MRVVAVGDLDDPRLTDYRNLKDARLAAERGRFIVEGRPNLRILLASARFEPASILLNERSFRALEPDLVDVDPACPIYVAPQPLLDRVVGFPIHRGCLAACPRPGRVDPVEMARELLASRSEPRIVVLDGVGNADNADNVGLVFRNARALGANAVVLCPRSCDPLYRKAIRTSMGGSLCVPFARADDLAAALVGLRRLGYSLVALDPAPQNGTIDDLDVDAVGAAALVLGSEADGLQRETLARVDRRLRIPMMPGVDSLNVAVASGIALHRLAPRSLARLADTGQA